MQRSRSTLWPEAGVAVALVALYVTATLRREQAATDELLRQVMASGVPAPAVEQVIADYQMPLHSLLPLLGGAAGLLLAWVAAHYLALPRLVRQPDTIGLLYLVPSLLLLMGSVWIAQYFKLYLRLQHNELGVVTGLKMYSLYRQKTLLAEGVATGIGLGLYELLGQLLWYLRQRLSRPPEPGMRHGYDALLVGLVG
ncbi:hypothetical protein [Hymenobacter volaticus]|uniref:ABC transporter permease n=1 Tax=Hymenobacter volaticus TaxID=2932254 RepID=A0ABY4GE53_9BACT|nr:hypothetical protein [Hymenobacter volaticus]UOQ69207.1 hypothetical protein MUN86_27525 [Hymenobacter volaticus]